jgi:DeoR/GlpR family transcriptional regulator of sugar metabolism
MAERLTKEQRHKRILSHLSGEVTVRINSLAKQFGVTTETIRRDIDELTDKGLVSRTYGGAASKSLITEPGIHQRQQTHIAERKQVANYAATLIEPGDVLMIDTGSTTSEFAKALADRMIPLTVLTNSHPIARIFGDNANVQVLMCPGNYQGSECGVFGQHTTSFLDHFQANKAIIGAGGINEINITDTDAEASWVKRKMIAQSNRTLVLLDHSKFYKRLFDNVCILNDIDDLVVDKQPPNKIDKALKIASVRLHVAK